MLFRSSLDTVTDGGGTDTIMSSATYTLTVGIENLTLTGATNQSTDTDAIDGTGNSANNFLTGNSGNNTLDGGIGADTMNGGAGNDTMKIDNTGDSVSGGSGVDTLQITLASGTYVMTNIDTEDAVLLGSSAFNVTGNSSNNTLDGSQNTAANVLKGQAGDDIYLVGTGDTVDDTNGAGADMGGTDTIIIKTSAFTKLLGRKHITGRILRTIIFTPSLWNISHHAFIG